jgi:putative transposase
VSFSHKNIRLPATNYVGQHWYFVTICCAERRHIFADSARALRLIEHLGDEAASHQFAVRAYCVMPDHLHALVLGLGPTSDMLALVKMLKQKTAYEFQRAFPRPLWQKKFYDHILRPNDSPAGVAAYIWMNPVRKGFCASPLDYPFSGSFALDWRKIISLVELWIPPWKTKSADLKVAAT